MVPAQVDGLRVGEASRREDAVEAARLVGRLQVGELIFAD